MDVPRERRIIPLQDVPEVFHPLLKCSPVKPRFWFYWWRAQSIAYLIRFNEKTRSALDQLRILQMESWNHVWRSWFCSGWYVTIFSGEWGYFLRLFGGDRKNTVGTKSRWWPIHPKFRWLEMGGRIRPEMVRVLVACWLYLIDVSHWT